MEKKEFLDLFEVATRAAAKSVTRSDHEVNSPEVSKCVDALNLLKKAPESLACAIVLNTSSIGKSFGVLINHKNSRIRTKARILKDLWLKHLYGTRSKQNNTKEKKKVSTGDYKRDKVREILQKYLSKVLAEVVVDDDSEMKNRVIACDPWTVAVSVESAMFERLGCFTGLEKTKYRSIFFNMGDSQNPDLRRKVLIGEIDGEKLVMMKSEEMGSKKIQMEIQLMKQRSWLRQESRIQMLPLDTIMT